MQTTFSDARRMGMVAVAPLAVIGAIATVLSIINSIKSLTKGSDSNRIAELCEEINTKIDALLKLQLAVLEELRALRVYFAEQLRNEFITALQIHLQTQIDLVDVTVKMWSRAQSAEELRQVRTRFDNIWVTAQNVILDLEKYGPAVYQTVGSGYGIVRVIHEGKRRLANSSNERRAVDSSEKSYLEKLLEKYNTWLDPTVSESLAANLQSITAELQSTIAQIAAQPREIIGIAIRYESKLRGRCEYSSSYRQDLIIHGTFESGFSDEIKETYAGDTPAVCPNEPRPGHEHDHQLLMIELLGEDGWRDYQKDFPKVSDSLMEDQPQRDLRLRIQDSARATIKLALQAVDVSTSSPLIASHPITDALNAKRSRAFALADNKATILEVLNNVSAVRDEIKRRIDEIKI